jgi:hypothetical protein
MIAKHKFYVGCRVEFNKDMNFYQVNPRILTGVLVGFCRLNKYLVRVLLDGQKSPQSWHMQFWKLAEVKRGS